jgi:hypothetical protein
LLPEHDHWDYNCIVTAQDGTVRRLYANWLHNNDQDFYTGWQCSAGESRFYIDSKFEVWSGQCRNNHLGNILSEWDPLENGAICQKQRCGGCTDDLVTKKYKQATTT